MSEEISYLQELLPLYAKNADDRLKIETELAAKKKALREAEQQQLMMKLIKNY